MDAEMNNQPAKQDTALWANELSNPEVQEALATLIHKLPQIKDAVEKAEQGIAAVSTFATDMDSLNYIAEGVDKFSKVALNKENLEALTVLIESLPRLAKMVTLLDKVATTVEPLVTDKNSLAYLFDTAKVVTSPVTDRVEEGVSIVKEAQARAEQNRETISIFGLMKMLKDPAVQKGLKFTQAFLDILSEKKIVK
ncbi:DUF1641 domain-containing protein [Aneurinibacillus sp. REN35]|uniref:DUF1641 domain-containing protein n=1 Tax=Aneurinibacillus sp. REN35 TaxID=3237286 RepID=UPI0035286E52